MKCNHCGSEWTTAVENQKDTCPFCGKQLESANSSQPAARGRFQLSYDKTTLVQFLGDEKNVVVPAGITRIGAGAFHGYGVETVYIPDGVTEIGDNCFNGCKQLREVRIPASVTHISDSAFKDTGKKTIIAEKGSYAWKKYAKPAAEDKPAVPNAPATANAIKKATPPPSEPVEELKKTVAPAEERTAKTQPANNKPSVDKFINEHVGKIQAQQAKETQWAKLLGCNPGEKPWIINSVFSFIEDQRATKLVKRLKNIFDQELLICIVTETNNFTVRRAAIKNIKDKKAIEALALSNPDWRVRKAALNHVTERAVLRKIAKDDPDKDIRQAAAQLAGDPTDPTEKHFVLIHDQVIKFLRAYSSVLPDEWYYYMIYPNFEHIYDSFEYYVEFKIMVGNWWDGLMREHSDVTDFMMTIFTFDQNERTFTHRIQVPASKSAGQFDRIPPMIHEYLDHYEANNPGVRLVRDERGATYNQSGQ